MNDAQKRIYAAFGFSPEEIAEIEASPEHQAYLRARADAAAEEETFVEYARALAARISAELNERLDGRA